MWYLHVSTLSNMIPGFLGQSSWNPRKTYSNQMGELIMIFRILKWQIYPNMSDRIIRPWNVETWNVLNDSLHRLNPRWKKSAAGQPLSTRASSEKNVTWCNMTWTRGSVEFGSILPPLKKRVNNHGGGSWTCWGKPTCEICMFHHFPALSMPEWGLGLGLCWWFSISVNDSSLFRMFSTLW